MIKFRKKFQTSWDTDSFVLIKIVVDVFFLFEDVIIPNYRKISYQIIFTKIVRAHVLIGYQGLNSIKRKQNQIESDNKGTLLF